ncbi:hypothetical protein LAZ67_15002215 [Cordylochernes scorpioides]|uniref:Mos1 transposase HTH domain-containing protein n=1 Tax=Cordylochernes scorpioides TaxID=51811 RepID=A0ABY6L9G5_9ARAC|nr:hypothetical protein LAZ67_15002215 [Cordylochernes scorpioides]
MDRKFEQRICIKFCYKIGKSASETLDLLKLAFGNENVNKPTTFRRFSRFENGMESGKDEKRVGRPILHRNPEKVIEYYKYLHSSFLTESHLPNDLPFPVKRYIAQQRILHSCFQETLSKSSVGGDTVCNLCKEKIEIEISHCIEYQYFNEEKKTFFSEVNDRQLTSVQSILTSAILMVALSLYNFYKAVFWIVFDFYLLKKMDQRTCIKFCVKNEIKSADAFRMLTVAYGEATLDRSNVYRWYKMFSEGREDVNDEERAGRPSTSTTDEKLMKWRK